MNFASRSVVMIYGNSALSNSEKCVPGGIRTPNLLIRSQKLYPVELQAHGAFDLRPNSQRLNRSKENLQKLNETPA
jgi:hypothetical protein